MHKHILTATAIVFAGTAFAQDVPEEVSTAVGAAPASVLEVLTSGDEYTVFVPTNTAIEGAPQEELQALLADEEQLASVIQGYAIEGTVMAADVMDMAGEEPTEVTTLGGGTLMVMVDGDTVMVGPSEDAMATVTGTDMQLGTVTIHTIDTAFLPTMDDMD